MTTYPTGIAPAAPRRLYGASITLIAAALAVILFGAWLIAAANRFPNGEDSNLPAAGAGQRATTTLPPTWTLTPGAGVTATSTPIPAIVSSSTPTPVPFLLGPEMYTFVHVAAPGETLLGIAARYAVSLETLREFNPDLDWRGCDFSQPNGGPTCNPILQPGQEIVVFTALVPTSSVMSVITATPIPFVITATPIPSMFPPTMIPPSTGPVTAEIAADALPLTLGESVDGTLDADKPMLTYTFTARAGDILDVRVEADAPVNLSSSLVSLPQPSGTGGGGGGSGGGPAQRTVSSSLSIFQDSVVWVTVSTESGTETAHFTLAVTRADLPALEEGEPVELDIDEEALARSNFGLWEFTGTQSDIVTFSAASEETDLMLTLSSVTGEELASDDDGGPGLNPEIYRFQLPYTGIYRIRVVPRAPWPGGGHLYLSAESMEPLSLDEGAQTLRINDSQSAWILSFTGEAGETVRLVATPLVNYGAPALVSITVEQSGAALVLGGGGQVLSEPQVTEIAVPADGPVRVYVNALILSDPQIGTSGLDLRFTLERP